MRRIAATVLFIAAFAAPLSAGGGKPLRILFVGNSLTYVNDLPEMVRRIGMLDGRRITTSMIAAPNYALDDHLQSAATRRTLVRGGWDVIVLQQGPSALDDSRRALIRDVTRVRAMAPAGAVVAILAVWPDRSRTVLFDRVVETHRLAADAIRGTLIPAGSAWRVALRESPSLPLYSADGFHPSRTGSYLAALATYRALVGKLPERAATADGARAVTGIRLPASEDELRILVGAAESD